MRAIKLSFRTPGIFLDEEGANFKDKLTFEINRSGSNPNWIPVTSSTPEITILKRGSVDPDNIDGLIVSRSLTKGTLDIPKRGEGTWEYCIIVRDNDEFEYRITTPTSSCPDCRDFFQETGELDKIDTESGKLILSKGKIESNTEYDE